MKVLLIYPNSLNHVLGWGDLGAVAEPLALEYLAAGAKLEGHEAIVLDLRLHPHALDQTVREFCPDVMGVTAYSMHVRSAIAHCARVKEILPSCRTVVGGHHATLLPEDFFESCIDHVVVGEGVAPFRALLRSVSHGSDGKGIAGMWTRSGASFTLGGPQAPFELDDLPFPDRSVTAGDRASYFIDWMKPIALLRTTVGCPYRCSFCSLWRIMDGRYHRHEIERVVGELATIAEDSVFLVDDEPFVNPRRIGELADAIRAAGIRKRYFAYCRIDSFLRDRELMEKWRDIGLERLFFGIEGVSGGELHDYNKRLQVAQVEEALKQARAMGIKIFSQFIVNPSYTKREFKHLARFIEHHQVEYPSFTVLTPLPGTPALTADFDGVLERQPNRRPNWDLFDCQNCVTATKMAPEEFRREYRNLHRLFQGSYAQYREHPPSPVRLAPQEPSAGRRAHLPVVGSTP